MTVVCDYGPTRDLLLQSGRMSAGPSCKPSVRAENYLQPPLPAQPPVKLKGSTTNIPPLSPRPQPLLNGAVQGTFWF